jgi:predicted nucleic acid-binding protein
MRIAVDTNILVRCLHHVHPDHSIANAALEILRRRNDQLLLFTQVACEWWAVATRPRENNGLGLSVPFAERVFSTLRESFQFVPDPPNLFEKWLELTISCGCMGKSAHDARVAAAASLAGANAIITFNVVDFRRFGALAVIDPRTMI